MSDRATSAGEGNQIQVSPLSYDQEAEPCAHCGSHWTHFTEYHGSYDCHCECCGRVFKSRERRNEEFDEELEVS